MSDTHAVLNLRQLECFVAAADAGTMTGAAERLSVTQSAVSLAVAGLEGSVGAQLFIRRRSRGLALTAAGRRLLPDARALLAHADDVRVAVAGEGSELRGRLIVGCFRTAAPFVLPGLMETFTAVHPGVELGFIEGPWPELEAALLDGRCEIALVYDLDIGPHVVCEPLYRTEPYVLLAPDHPLAALDEIAVADLVAHDWIALDIPPSREYLEQVFVAGGHEPVPRYAISSYELVRSMVARGMGYGLLISRPAGDVSYEGRPLVARPLAGEAPAIDVSLARARGTRPTRRATAFAAHCREVLPARFGAGIGSVRSGSDAVSGVDRHGAADRP